MPQMSPMWWEILFILFVITYIFMNTLIYWMSNKYINTKKETLKSLNYNWKW